MRISNYIVRGGENLNTTVFVGLFPQTALTAFENWYPKLTKNSKEKESYIECPVDKNNRLFIRAYWVKQPGERSVCYYVGFLIPFSEYIEAGEYYKINRGLSEISLNAVQNAARTNNPLDINIELPLPRTAIGQSFDFLADWKKYGGKEFQANIHEFLFSVSINNITDWFSLLIVAVNPHLMDPAYNVVISREEPLPSWDVTIPRKSSVFENSGEENKQDCRNASTVAINSKPVDPDQDFQATQDSACNETNDRNSHQPHCRCNRCGITLSLGVVGLFIGLISLIIGLYALKQTNIIMQSCSQKIAETQDLCNRIDALYRGLNESFLNEDNCRYFHTLRTLMPEDKMKRISQAFEEEKESDKTNNHKTEEQ